MIHCIVQTRGNKLITKGDNLRATAFGYAERIQGRIEFVVDDQTGIIRDMRARATGEVVTLEEALARIQVASPTVCVAKN